MILTIYEENTKIKEVNMQALIILCLKIFFCRIIDVSLGSIKTIVMVKGKSLIAALIAFVEGLIWFLIVREALLFDASVGKLFIAFAYAGGYAAGTYIGTFLADKFVTGNVHVQVVTSRKNEEILEEIRDAGYAITVLDVSNTLFGRKKYMLFAEMRNSQLAQFKELVYTLDEKAFIMVNETKFVYNGFFKK